MHVVRRPIEKIAREGGRTGRLRRMSDVFFTAAAVMLFGTAPAWAQPALEILGHWGGAVQAVFVDPAVPDIAYVGAGRRLVILDVADPADIIELGAVDVEEMVMSVKARDGYAYVGTMAGPHQFSVVDVSDPANPRFVTSLDTFYDVGEIGLYGDLAYVLSRIGYLEVIDISDPEHPVYLGYVRLGTVIRTLSPYALTIAGDLMYVAISVGAPAESPKLGIYDLSLPGDPVNPTLLSSAQLDWPPCWARPVAIAVGGDYAYITTEDPAFAVVDVSNPEAPVARGYYEDFASPHDVAVASDRYVYVADWAGGAQTTDSWYETKGLAILDVSDPDNPTLAGTFKTRAAIEGVEVVGSRAYLMDEGEGLIVLDVSDPIAPVRLGNWHCPAELQQMWKVADLLYVTDEWNGISILDVSDPADPTLVGVYQTSEDSGYWGRNWGIEVRDELAYLCAGWGGIEIVDVSQPANPTLKANYPFPYCIRSVGIELDGDIAHVGTSTCGGGGWIVEFDISDPNNPVPLGDAFLGSDPRTMTTSAAGGITYVARWLIPGHSTLTVVDTSDPNAPWVIGDAGRADDLALRGALLYVGDGTNDPDEGGLRILDVSEPTEPTELGYFPAARATGLDVENGLVYLLADCEGLGKQSLLVLDVSDPRAPVPAVPLEQLPPLPGALKVLVDGRYAYVTGNRSPSQRTGLAIVRVADRIPGDLNDDGCVDLADLATLLANYDTPSGMTYADGDLDGDEDVDLADLAGLLAHYGEGYP